jgi:hypothetical protein
MMMKYASSLLTGVMLAAVAGCGSDRPPTGAVHGTVSLGDELLKEGEVALFSVDFGAGANCVIEPDGKFRFADPVPVGTYQVAISGVRPRPDMRPPYPVSKVPKKFWNMETSGLTLSVHSGDNQHDFKLPAK